MLIGLAICVLRVRTDRVKSLESRNKESRWFMMEGPSLNWDIRVLALGDLTRP